MYAFKRVDKVGGKDLPLIGCKEQAVAFLDSLILGEVIMKFFYGGEWLTSFQIFFSLVIMLCVEDFKL